MAKSIRSPLVIAVRSPGVNPMAMLYVKPVIGIVNAIHIMNERLALNTGVIRTVALAIERDE